MPKAPKGFSGYTSEEAVGRTVAELLIPADRQDEETEILNRLRRGERVDHFETMRRRKDGALLDISLTISPVKDAHGRIIGASKIARYFRAKACGAGHSGPKRPTGNRPRRPHALAADQHTHDGS